MNIQYNLILLTSKLAIELKITNTEILLFLKNSYKLHVFVKLPAQLSKKKNNLNHDFEFIL